MFTGIIDHCGTIRALSETGQCSIDTQFTDLTLGESIAVDGVCLTVDGITDAGFSCVISPETRQKTTGSHFAEGRLVHLERALLPTTRLGGHFVTGHVDGCLKVKKKQSVGDCVELTLAGLTPTTRPLVTYKGSIALNGVSLTVNAVTPEDITVLLIPHTLEQTHLGFLQEKDEVNVEFDIMARIISEQLKLYQPITSQHG